MKTLTIETEVNRYPTGNGNTATSYRGVVRDECGAAVYQSEVYSNRQDARDQAALYIRNARELTAR